MLNAGRPSDSTRNGQDDAWSDNGLELARISQRRLDDPLLGHVVRLRRRARERDASCPGVDDPSSLWNLRSIFVSNDGASPRRGREERTFCANSNTSFGVLKKSNVAASVMGKVL